MDHSAIRDAYAIVQIANGLEEVEIDGTTYSFDDLKNDKAGFGWVYYLSKDCNSLLSFNNWNNAYGFQESGMGDDGSPCPDCTLWDDSNPCVDVPMSKLHKKKKTIILIIFILFMILRPISSIWDSLSETKRSRITQLSVEIWSISGN